MTDEEISGLSGAFGSYLGRYRDCFLQDRTARHFDDFCRGLLEDIILPQLEFEDIILPQLEQVAERSTLAQVVAGLRQPLCYGEAWQAFLTRVENLTHQTFKTRWDMVRWLRQHHPEINLLTTATAE